MLDMKRSQVVAGRSSRHGVPLSPHREHKALLNCHSLVQNSKPLGGTQFFALFLAMASFSIITNRVSAESLLLQPTRAQLTNLSLPHHFYERLQPQHRQALQTTPNQFWSNTKALDGPCRAGSGLQTAGAVDKVTA